MISNKKSEKEIANEKSQRILEGIAYWCGFYRENPQRFCKDYLHIRLKLFQKILIYAMMHNNYILYLASRGQGKTYLTAIFAVVRCILYPKTKIVVASATRTQGNEVLLKITDDLMKNYDWGSDNLRREINEKETSVGANKAVIYFRNGSWIKVVTASDTGRGFRGNILICDEYRMVDKQIIDKVLRKYLTAERQPLYLNDPKYSHLKERNKEIYMSSAWLKSHWSYDKAKAYTFNFFDDTKKYFICGLPYQLSIYENLLSREQVEDEMSEDDFDATSWSIEMGCLFFGDTDGTFFTFDDIDKRRKLKNPFYPPTLNSKNSKIPDLVLNERRILSADIALMASKKTKNDATSIFINSAIPTNDNNYISNIIYSENHEGLNTDEVALIIRRLFSWYKCTDLVLDTGGQGLGVYDALIKDIIDPTTGELYSALSCCNDKVMAERCKVSTAPKVIWSIKANAAFNNEACILLRSGFKQGKINLLVSELEAEEILKDKYKNFSKMLPNEQLQYKMPYIQTTLLIYELISLEYEVKGTNIKITERSGMRKDRYSSLSYNYWVQCQLERETLQKIKTGFDINDYASKLRKLNKRPTIY
jgi:hypothetical protein